MRASGRGARTRRLSLISSQLFVAAVLAAAAAHQHPAAVELLAVELELEVALRVALRRIVLRHPGAAVPQHHRARAVLLRRDHAFEVAVFERMVLDMHREPLVVGSRLGPLGTAQLSSTPLSSSRKS